MSTSRRGEAGGDGSSNSSWKRPATNSVTGDENGPALPENPQLLIHVDGTDELERVDVIRSGAVADRAAIEGRSGDLSAALPGLRSGDYVYVRVVQKDGALAWSSPFFLR